MTGPTSFTHPALGRPILLPAGTTLAAAAALMSVTAAADSPEVNRHYAPEGVEAMADCIQIISPNPGAMIAFPSEEGPGWQNAGPGPVEVEVVGCFNSADERLTYAAYHGADTEPTLTGTVGTDPSPGDWSRFSFEDVFWTAGQWRIVVSGRQTSEAEPVAFAETMFKVDPPR